MGKLYGILNSDGKLSNDFSHRPWLSQYYESAKIAARVANGKAVRVEVVICTPKSRTKLVKPGPTKKAARDSYARGKSLVDEFKRKGYATIKPKGARVSPRKAK